MLGVTEKAGLLAARADVVNDPFPHVITPTILDPSLYAALRADYPTAGIFLDQKDVTGTKGSRTGQGFDIYRGDAAYDRLLSSSDAWREFDAYINSAAFVETFLELFGDQLAEIGCTAEIEAQNFDRDLIEPREELTETVTVGDRLAKITSRLMPAQRAKPCKLFTRLDIHKALAGYAKPVHCDRPNRLCSLIIYFCDADEIGLEGGELMIYRHNKAKPYSQYERHPKADDVSVIAKIKPKQNLGIFFPCCNNSYHGVTEVLTKTVERDYLYINISGHAKSIW